MAQLVFLVICLCLVRLISYFHQKCIVDCLIRSENFRLLLWVFGNKAHNMFNALMGYGNQFFLFFYYFAVNRRFFNEFEVTVSELWCETIQMDIFGKLRIAHSQLYVALLCADGISLHILFFGKQTTKPMVRRKMSSFKILF